MFNQFKRMVRWQGRAPGKILFLCSMVGCCLGLVAAACRGGPLGGVTPPPPVFIPIVISSAATVRVDYQAVIGPGPAEYGVNGWWTDQDADLWRTRYAQLAPAIVRLPAAQSMLEPRNDDSDPTHINRQGFLFDQPFPWQGRTITFRQWLSTLRDQDITAMLHVPYLAGWLSANGDNGLMSTYPPRDLAEYSEYLRALLSFAVDEVGYPPEHLILEPVNEPDLGCGQDPNVPCFWNNWQMADLVAVMRAADEAAAEVAPAIRIVGVSECCGTQLAESLMDSYGGSTLLDGFTYHRYVSGDDFSDGLTRGQRLAHYGKPVYLNEYGNTTHWSNGQPGALWHASVLPQIWAAGLNPIQFSMAEFPGSHEGYKQLGLFTDWQDGWKLKPAYWVYANFYRHLGGSQLVAAQGSARAMLLAGRRPATGQPSLAIWLTNVTADQSVLPIEIVGFPARTAHLQVYNNLQGDDPVASLELAGESLRFDFRLPAASSFCIVVQP